MSNDLTEFRGSSPVDNATRFLQNGGNTEQLEKMMELQERWEANEARKAFHDSMTQAQKMMPVVAKDAYNQQTRSNYSKHETLVKKSKEVYTAAGFSLMFYEGETPKQNHIRIMCDVRHEKGHMETRFIDLALDNSGIKGTVNKTGVHAAGSTFTYGRRYLTCMIFNIPTGEDVDGNQNQQPERKTITPDTPVGWKKAKEAYIRDNSFENVLKHADISEAHQKQIIEEIGFEQSEAKENEK